MRKRHQLANCSHAVQADAGDGELSRNFPRVFSYRAYRHTERPTRSRSCEDRNHIRCIEHVKFTWSYFYTIILHTVRYLVIAFYSMLKNSLKLTIQSSNVLPSFTIHTVSMIRTIRIKMYITSERLTIWYYFTYAQVQSHLQKPNTRHAPLVKGTRYLRV